MTRHIIRPETPDDIAPIAKLHRAAFGPDEPIPQLVERLRALSAALPTLSFVACEAAGPVVGHVMLSHAWLDAPDRLIDILVLSPLGVATHAQRNGVGTALLAHAVTEAARTPAPILILEGDPGYYGPRGFEPATALGLRAPSLRIPDRAMQLVRLPGYRAGMTGSLVYRDLWWDLDCVGLR
ncbi:MAG: N-acetyltransferase [Pseudomonadota bacterium]